jgi:hypothetical protein
MTDLRELRPYLDALADDALAAALDRPVADGSRRRPMRWVATAAAVIVVGVVIAAVLVRASDSTPTGRVRVGQNPNTTEPSPPQSLAAAYPECVKTETTIGCRRTPAEASRMLGIPIDVPAVVPDGWPVVHKVVRISPAGVEPLLLPRDVGDYSQVWAPGGVVATDDPSPDYLQIRERAAGLPGDDMCLLGPLPPLADGTPVCGYASEEPFPGSAQLGGSVLFVRGGVRYSVSSLGLTQSQIYAVLNSLR